MDRAELEAASRAAVRAIVPKQREAGIDIPNDGEQGADPSRSTGSTGLGGSSGRGGFADVEAYPDF